MKKKKKVTAFGGSHSEELSDDVIVKKLRKLYLILKKHGLSFSSFKRDDNRS